jgi:UDP-GlcNAc:undecaprenyl-phosphate GlcNAc-1-phosphate transferase
MIEFLVIMTIACLAGSVLTPSMRFVARKTGLVDHPDGRRKLHLNPVALGGGLAVFLATLIGVICALIGRPALLDGAHFSFFLGLLGSSLFIVGVGLIDDRYHLRGRQKLLGQIVAVSILVASGLVVREIQVFDWHMELGLLAIPFTMFWLLGSINALNLIDGLDGLASGVGVILSLAIAGMAWMTMHEADAVVAIALCGGLLGFLIYNFPPASIYLGDAGSMLIGLLLGALAMRSSLKGAATVALMAPTVIWAIPILDVGMAILRRKLTGRSIYETDRGHLHHCLLRRGYSGRMTLVWIGLFCAVTAVGALVSVARQNEWMAVISAVAVFGTLVLTRMFGYAECMLLGGRLKSVFSSLIAKPNPSNGNSSSPFHARLTGTRDWEDLWKTLTEYAEHFDLSAVQLNVNLPALNEEYHVNWNRRDRGPERQQWTTDIPLIARGITVGRLRISGRSADDSICSWMGDLIAGLKPFEMQMLSLVSDQMDGNAFHDSRCEENVQRLVEANAGQSAV